MIVDDGKIMMSIYKAIDEINIILPKKMRLSKSPSTKLSGDPKGLDSLGLVSFIVATEEKLENNFGITLSLTDEESMSQKNSPFQTVQTLTDYISMIIDKQDNG